MRMTCALCRQDEANKKNTHYLTDGIIRNCLNQDGSNDRGKGLYFDVSSNKLFTDFNFQQATSIEALEEVLGREPSEKEIEKAKQIAFSVDYVFCSKCEDIFTKIENNFIESYRDKFRGEDLTGLSELSFEDTTTIRLFFLTQVWRTGVCVPDFKISPAAKEEIRKLIRKPDPQKLKTFPLAVTYLTTRDAIEYTTNRVGYAIGSEPNIIFMCDFLIQFYEPDSKLPFLSIYGANNKDDYKKYINHKESTFVFKIISNEERKSINWNMAADKSQRTINALSTAFQRLFVRTYGQPPSNSTTEGYIKGLVNWNEIVLVEQLTEQRILEYTSQFFRNIGI